MYILGANMYIFKY